MGLLACVALLVAVLYRYHRLRVRGALNNTLWELLYVLFPLPWVYLWAMWLFGAVSEHWYGAYLQQVSTWLDFMRPVVPGLVKSEQGFLLRGMEFRALEVAHNYSVIILFGVFTVLLFCVHALFLSEKEKAWLDSQPAELFEPGSRLMLGVIGLLFLAMPAFMSAVDTAIVCRGVGRCWSSGRSNFPVFYMLAVMYVMAGLVVGGLLRRLVAWNYKNGARQTR